jgi:hypothetical protein
MSLPPDSKINNKINNNKTMATSTALITLQQQWQSASKETPGTLSGAAKEFLSSEDSLPQRLEQLCDTLQYMVRST